MFRGRSARLPYSRVIRPPSPPEFTYSLEPTPKQCAEVKRILAAATHFPPEVVDIVMDFAEYWACSVASVEFVGPTRERVIEVQGSGPKENMFILRTEPLGLTGWHSSDQDQELWQKEAPPRKLEEEYSREELKRYIDGPPIDLEHPFRKVVFDITSRDQGWSHNKSFSWTWFDAGIDRFDKGNSDSADGNELSTSDGPESGPTASCLRPVWPPLREDGSAYYHELRPSPNHKIRCNQVATSKWQDHHIEWSYNDNIDPESSAGAELDASGRGKATGDGSFVRSLRVGDMVTIWGRARFPGWTNYVRKAQIRVYWAL